MRTGLRARAAAAMVLALMSLAACTDARPDTARTNSPKTPTTTATSSTPTVDPQAAAEADVLAAYRGFWAAATEAEAHPHRRHPQLARFATDKALAAEQATIVLYRQQGIVGRGKPKLSPEVVALSISSGTAVIRDCLDLTNVDAIYRDTGKSAIAPDQSRRHLATAKAAVYDGRWVIRDLVANRKQPC